MSHARIYSPIHDIQWSGAEKAIARKAFENAYERECGEVLTELKKMTATASSPRDIWKIHDYLSEQRRNTDEKYDYRYSVLIFVFAKLISEGWLTEHELLGLREDKIEKIRIAARL